MSSKPAPRRGLGRGLGSLIPTAPREDAAPEAGAPDGSGEHTQAAAPAAAASDQRPCAVQTRASRRHPTRACAGIRCWFRATASASAASSAGSMRRSPIAACAGSGRPARM